MEAIFSLVVWILFIIIALFLLYWVVKSAINDSELVAFLRDLNHKLEQMKSNDIGLNEEEAQDQKIVECPACNTWIPIDSSTCPECGIVFQNE